MIKNIENTIINIKFENQQLDLPDKIKKEINDFWNQCKLENPSLWNGKLLCVSDYKKNNKKMMITCQITDYNHHLFDERIGLSSEYGCYNLVAGCLLETNDNYYVIGEMASNTSFPNGLQIPGGNVDKNDIQNNNIDIVNTLLREVKEEINIDLYDNSQVKSFQIKYISLPSESSHAYLLIAKAKLNMTKEEMQNHYEKYLSFLQKNNFEIEFEKIHFIKKDLAIRQLNKFQNQKRSYLKELLELDSKDITI